MKVIIPATSANLGPGFDTLGIALSLYNEIEFEASTDGTSLTISGEGKEQLPTDRRNLAIQAMEQVFQRLRKPFPDLHVHMVNRIPLARGLGSSAATIVGGLVAANTWCKNALTTQQLLEMATDMEGHPDNVAPALVGGFTISIKDGCKVSHIRIDPPQALRAVVAVPAFTLATSTARSVLPQSVSLHDAVFNVSRASLLVAALATEQLEYLNDCVQDKLHQPYREGLIPAMQQVFAAARQAGALATAISGAGPCLIAFCTGHAEVIGQQMVAAFAASQIKAHYLVLTPDKTGAIVQ